ncbi:MAG: EF-hand domain-containing protein [Sulfitobacter sp.]
MRHSKNFALLAVATLGLAAVAVSAVAQQTQMEPGQMMGDHDGMMGGHSGMGMMMGGGQNYAMATFDTNKDGTLSPEEMTVGIQAEIKTYDADGNGTLSLEEFAVMRAAHTRPMTVRAFQMHDPDGDAQVTEAEMAAMAAIMGSHSGRQHGDIQGRHRGMMGND